MKKIVKGEFNKSPKAAYMGFLFQTFLKRPFGYIIGILYVLYLAVILLIVPAVIHQHPLFIWNTSTFNMPLFNLFFIAAETSAIAVAIYRTGREDGTDLSISAKPLTKNNTVWIKTGTYLIIILLFCLISVFIAALILPIFGKYDLLLHPTGVTISEYRGIIISVLVGNLVNMFLFGAISIFISLVGGQVITMIGTICLAFLISLLNFLYPMVIKSPYDVIIDDYNTNMMSFKTNTISQYFSDEEIGNMISYCAIECHTEEEGKPKFDTKDVWDDAVIRSKNKVINYIDIGKQLSTLYTAFGLESLRLEDAKELPIGTSVEYDYTVDGTTNVAEYENVKTGNYPICVYDIKSSAGVTYPVVRIVGGCISDIDLDNWYIRSKLMLVDSNTIVVASRDHNDLRLPWEEDRERESTFKNGYSNNMEQLRLNNEQQALVDAWWDEYVETDWESSDIRRAAIVTNLKNDTSGLFYKGNWDDLTGTEKQHCVGAVHLYWSIKALQQQQTNIIEVLHRHEERELEHNFPFSSSEISKYYDYLDTDPKEEEAKIINQNILKVITDGFSNGVSQSLLDDDYYSCLVASVMPYAETYENLYQFTVTPFYSIYTIVGVWSGLAVIMLSASIIVYKKTDFK